jgi:glycosyltransferase involved in cell wall biosynthesis
MYLPRNLPLCRPHIAMWVGESGKQYEFAVARPGTIAIDEPAVFILAKQEGARTTPLHVGHTSSLHRKFGLSSRDCPDEWRRALAMGMTHVHLRFDACSDEARRAEVMDLAAALMPAIALASASDEAADGSAFRGIPARTRAARVHKRQDRELVPAAGSAQFSTLVFASTAKEDRGAFTNSLASASFFRADPAREDDGDAPDLMTWVGSTPSAEQRPKLFDGESPFANDEHENKAIRLEVSSEPIRYAATDRAEQKDMAQVAESSKTDVRSGLSISGFIQRLLGFVARHRAPRHATPEVEPAPTRPTFGMERVVASEIPAESHPPAESCSPAESAQGDQTEGSSAEVEQQDDVEQQYYKGVGTSDIEGQDKVVAAVAVPEQPRTPDATIIDVPEVAPPPQQQPLATEAGASQQEDAKRTLDLDPAAPVVLFAGSMSYEAGADILMDAVTTVCGDNDEAVFLFAGDGALKGELQARASRAGLDRRCRFLGDVPAEAFHTVLAACDFVVIPARIPLGEGLARMALANGKPVLVTHQAALGFIVHGWNGLVTYDNPGSFVWGIRELLGPLRTNLRRHLSDAA